MVNNDRARICIQTSRRNILLIIKNGVRALTESKTKIAIMAAFIIIMVIQIVCRTTNLNNSINIFDKLNGMLMIAFLSILLIPGILLILYIFGMPPRAHRVNTMMRRISVKNKMGETPVLIGKRAEEGSNVVIYEFIGYGIPITFYEDNTAEIEAALNAKVVKIKQGKSLFRILVCAVGYEHSLPRFLQWQNELVRKKDFELVVGRSLLGDVTVDLNRLPHMLIGGSTGSGKSVLLKSLIYQCYLKGAEIHIADFKGGIDFNGRWNHIVQVVTDIDQLVNRLESIVEELHQRKLLFYRMYALNICDYREKTLSECKRIVFACDEVAEILDKTGLSKEMKEKVARIESLLSTIARQGRAFGINLILATQRPDATILSGQIRNNIDYRTCGRADDVLSKIVLDNTDASEKIPKDEQGLFLDNQGTTFRAYYFEETDIVE